jgi:DUF2917 family protein
MQIRLAFKHMFLEPGKTFAVPTVAGARVRVVDGKVWATTSSSPDDVWLGAGEEYTVRSPGLTVIESVGRSTVELIPPAATGARGHIMNRFDIGIPRAVCTFAAVAMTVIAIGLLVILPAKLGSDSQEARLHQPSSVAALPTTVVVSQSRSIVNALKPTSTQASSGVAPPTLVH